MEAKTRPKYNEFLKEWSNKHKITSFFGSDKPEFLRAWNKVKIGGVNNIRPTVSAAEPAGKKDRVPVVAVPEPETVVAAPVEKKFTLKEIEEIRKKNSKYLKDLASAQRRENRSFINPSTKFSVKYTPEDFIKDKVPVSEQLRSRKRSMGAILD